jgi:hypothetical protein
MMWSCAAVSWLVGFGGIAGLQALGKDNLGVSLAPHAPSGRRRPSRAA